MNFREIYKCQSFSSLIGLSPNSPLVIHEALLANISVITSNLGGMAELIENEKKMDYYLNQGI